MTMSNADPHAVDPTAPPVAVSEFREVMAEAGAEGVVGPALRMFLDQIDPMSERLRDAFAADDTTGIAQAAHAFKSGALTVYARDLGAGLDRIEKLAKQGDLAACTTEREAVFSDVARVKAYLSTVLQP